MIYVNGQAVNTTVFPDNTSQVWKLPLEKYHKHVSVRWDYSNEAEVMQLAQLKELLDVNGFTADLDITYLPYARQDKAIDNQSTFALRVFANILNSMKWNVIAIQDPHSSLALDLIFKSYAYYPHRELTNTIIETKSDAVCYPDKGAFSKYTSVYEHICLAYADKVRNPLSGEIIGMGLHKVIDLTDKRLLIVDDICDGGRTFTELAKLLYENGAKEVNLFVTHGLFTKGLRPLKDAGILNVYTPKGVVKQSDFQKGV